MPGYHIYPKFYTGKSTAHPTTEQALRKSAYEDLHIC